MSVEAIKMQLWIGFNSITDMQKWCNCMLDTNWLRYSLWIYNQRRLFRTIADQCNTSKFKTIYFRHSEIIVPNIRKGWLGNWNVPGKTLPSTAAASADSPGRIAEINYQSCWSFYPTLGWDIRWFWIRHLARIIIHQRYILSSHIE